MERVDNHQGIPLGKATIIFSLIMVGVVALGVIIGQSFFWDTYSTTSPVDKDIQYLEGQVKATPNSDKLLVELGWLYYRKGDYQKATNTLNQALTINGKNPAAHYNLGLAYTEIKLLDKASVEFQKTLELDPESKYAYFSLGKLSFAKEEWDEAIKHFQNAVNKDPVSVENYFWLGQAYEKRGFKAEALAAYQKVLDRVPDHSAAKEAYYKLK